jgi:phosphopantetheinyl transferase
MTDTAWADLLPAGTVWITTPIAEPSHFPVRHGKHGEPLWPEDRVGSVTHAGGYRTVATADADLIQALGIDMELIVPLPPEVWSHFLCDEELDELLQFDPPQRGQVALSLWCMKEALLKAVQGRVPLNAIPLRREGGAWQPAPDLSVTLQHLGYDLEQLTLRAAVKTGWQRAVASFSASTPRCQAPFLPETARTYFNQDRS